MNIVSSIVEIHVFRVTNEGLEFLILKRAENEVYPGIWQMVAGHINENEKAVNAAIRETIEETGIKPLQMWVIPLVNHFYSHEKDFISLVPVFAARVSEDSVVTICEEHCECRWVDAETAKNLLAWPGQRNAVNIISEYFTEKLNLLNFTEIKIT